MISNSNARTGAAKANRGGGNKVGSKRRFEHDKIIPDAGTNEEDPNSEEVSSRPVKARKSLVLARLTPSADTGADSLEKRLLRVLTSGEDVDVRKAVRKGTGKPNYHVTKTAETEEQSVEDNPNFEPLKEAADSGNDITEDKNERGEFHSRGRGAHNRGRGRGARRPHLGDLRRMGKRATTVQLERTRSNFEFAKNQLAVTELLLQEQGGFIELEPGESVADVTQRNLKDVVDITAATKIFDLELHQYGPYHIDYTRNGRHLLLGGRKGHVAVVEWHSKRLMCEINVMDAVYDVAWLHQETMLAVAQKDWLFLYDNQGIELHCIEKMDNILKMEYLPYHFLLATANDSGYLRWLDISIGKMVAATKTPFKRLDVMCQNPWNAVLMLGHTTGTVSMWSPNTEKPLATMLCHRHPVRAVAVNSSGNYMATAATDGYVKMWDLRAMKSLHGFQMKSPPTTLAFSQRGLLAVGMQNSVQILKDVCTKMVSSPYLCHSVGSQIRDLVFCPYEDVLGIGHMTGFSSILVPGAAEANFDSLECNPYRNTKQRRQQEVKSLLDKIQPEMICLDPTAISSSANISLEAPNDAANLKGQRKMPAGKYDRELVRQRLQEKKEQTGSKAKKRHATVLERFKPKA